jgi:hypothetical protein
MFLRHKRPAGSERDDSVQLPLRGVGVPINQGRLRRCIEKTHECVTCVQTVFIVIVIDRKLRSLLEYGTTTAYLYWYNHQGPKKQNETRLVAIGHNTHGPTAPAAYMDLINSTQLSRKQRKIYLKKHSKRSSARISLYTTSPPYPDS